MSQEFKKMESHAALTETRNEELRQLRAELTRQIEILVKERTEATKTVEDLTHRLAQRPSSLLLSHTANEDAGTQTRPEESNKQAPRRRWTEGEHELHTTDQAAQRSGSFAATAPLACITQPALFIAPEPQDELPVAVAAPQQPPTTTVVGTQTEDGRLGPQSFVGSEEEARPPPPPPPSPPPPVIDTSAVVLVAELLQVLVQQSQPVLRADTSIAIATVVDQVECVLQAVEERLTAVAAGTELVSAVRALTTRLAQAGESRVLLLKRFGELQEAFAAKCTEAEHLENDLREALASAPRAALADTSLQRQIDTLQAEMARLTEELAKSRTTETRVSQQNARMRVLVSQAQSQLTELKEKVRTQETDLTAVRSELEQARLQIDYSTRSPTRALLDKLGLEASVVLKVEDPSTHNAWCCLSTKRRPTAVNGKAEEEASSSGPHPPVGISWWKESDLVEGHLLEESSSLPSLQTRHAEDVALYQQTIQQLQSKARFLEKRWQQAQAQFDAYKRKVAAALMSHHPEEEPPTFLLIDVAPDMPPPLAPAQETPCASCAHLRLALSEATARLDTQEARREGQLETACLKLELSTHQQQLGALREEKDAAEHFAITKVGSLEDLVQTLRTQLVAQHERIQTLTRALAEQRVGTPYRIPATEPDEEERRSISSYQSGGSRVHHRTPDNLSVSSTVEAARLVSETPTAPPPPPAVPTIVTPPFPAAAALSVRRRDDIQNEGMRRNLYQDRTGNVRELRRQVRLLERQVLDEQNQQSLMLEQVGPSALCRPTCSSVITHIRFHA